MAFDIQPPQKKKTIPVANKLKPQPKPVKASKVVQSNNSLGLKILIIFIGLLVLVGGVVFLRQYNFAKAPQSVNFVAGVVNKFDDIESESVVPVTEDQSAADSMENNLIQQQKNFADSLEADTTESNIIMNDNFVNNFNEYLKDF